MANWSQLPYDITISIANKLHDVGDFVVFSSICHNWRLVYENRDWKPPHILPWLMLNEHHDHENNVTKRQFCNSSTFKIYNQPLPEAFGSICWGTPHGWIVSFNQDCTIRLLDPISRASVELPPTSVLMNNNDWFSAIQKAIVLRLDEDRFVVMVIYKYNRALAFAKPGDSDWTPVNFPSTLDIVHVVRVVDKIFAVIVNGALMQVHIEGAHGAIAEELEEPSPPEDEEGWLNIYLAEAQGHLLLVFRYEEDIFRVYVHHPDGDEWVPFEWVGDTVLLVDEYGCISICGHGDLHGSRVYFVDDNLDILLDYPELQGVYLTVSDLEDYSSEVFKISGGSSLYNCPVWMVPRLW